MKKIFIILTLFCSLKTFAQSDSLLALHGVIVPYVHYTLPNTATRYFTGFGTFGSFYDTARAAFSLTTTGTSGAATYNSSTGVFNIPQYAAGTGTVTSVGFTAPSGFAITGSPVTTSGTLALAWTGAVQGDVPYFSGTNTAAFLNKSTTAGFVLTNGGTSNNPTWGAPFTLTTTGSSGAATFSAGTLNIPSYSGGAAGWSLTGNTGATNILGLTSNNALNIYTNNIKRAWVDSATYRFFIDSVPFSRGGFSAAGNNITNIGIGDSALYVNTSGNHNVGLGYQVLARSTTASGNVAIGYNALKITTGGALTAVGADALEANTSGANNVAFGAGALQLNSIGGSNTAVGSAALAANTTTSQSTAVGHQALTNSTGQQNTGVGYQALKAITTNTLSTAIGSTALGAATGAQNTAIGAGAGNTFTLGNGNFFAGVQSGTQLPAGSASSFNTFVGAEYNFNKGLTAASSNNTIIGANFLSATTSLTSTVILTDGLGLVRYWSNATGQTGIMNRNPTASLSLPPGRSTQFGAPLKIPYFNLVTTAATSAAGSSTLTFAAQPAAPFSPGDTIVVAGITPAGFNGTYVVTASTTTTVKYAGATAGPQTVAGTITTSGLLTIPESGAIETAPVSTGTTRPYFTGADGIRGFIPLTFTGTAAPATTPSAVGDHFVDTTNKKEYVATGTASSADWTILN